MCLILIARDRHPRYRIVLAANRDEFHDRPTAAMQWWNGAQALLAGRDLRSGGTWFAAGRDGRFGALANYFNPAQADQDGLRSRGELVPDWLTGTGELLPHAHQIVDRGGQYQPFNCLLGGPDELLLVSNCDPLPIRKLEPGIYGLSNDLFERPFVKVRGCGDRLEAILSQNDRIEPETLLSLLATTEPMTGPGDASVTSDEAEHARRSAPMVVNAVHGTRAATVLLIDRDGQVEIVERRFDRAGNAIGQDEFRFEISK